MVLNGDIDPPYLRRQLEAADLVVGADGGAAAVTAAGGRCDVIVGDQDSLTIEALAAAQARNPAVEIRVHPREKDATDAELALAAAVDRGADAALVVGAFGGERRDHEVANVLLLAHAGWRGLDVTLGDPHQEIRLVTGRREWCGAVGDLVTLLAVGGDAEGVTTHGLQYALRDSRLAWGSSRGVSNVMREPTAAVEVRRGSLLVIHWGTAP